MLANVKHKTLITLGAQAHAKKFPNVAVMARQYENEYLGCPATSASVDVERLFSQVRIASANKRKRADAATLEDIMFSRIKLP